MFLEILILFIFSFHLLFDRRVHLIYRYKHAWTFLRSFLLFLWFLAYDKAKLKSTKTILLLLLHTWHIVWYDLITRTISYQRRPYLAYRQVTLVWFELITSGLDALWKSWRFWWFLILVFSFFRYLVLSHSHSHVITC